jgi:hypothetical protein
VRPACLLLLLLVVLVLNCRPAHALLALHHSCDWTCAVVYCPHVVRQASWQHVLLLLLQVVVLVVLLLLLLCQCC